MKDDYLKFLPIDGATFQTNKGTWLARIRHDDEQAATSNNLFYKVVFEPMDGAVPLRELVLITTKETLEVLGLGQKVMADVKTWLENEDGNGELKVFS